MDVSRLCRVELKKAEEKGKQDAQRDLEKINRCLGILRSDWSDAVKELARQYLHDLTYIKELEQFKQMCLEDSVDKNLAKYYNCTMREKGIWTESDEELLKMMEEEYYPLAYKNKTLHTIAAHNVIKLEIN